MQSHLRTIVLATAFLFASTVYGQGSAAISIGDPLTKADLTPKLKFDVPSSAGFAILGVSPENVLTPRKGSELALGLLNGLDQEGNFQSGLAIEANPYFWLLPEQGAAGCLSQRSTISHLFGFQFFVCNRQRPAQSTKRVRV